MKEKVRKFVSIPFFLALLFLAANCSGGGAVFEECTVDDDCPSGQICISNSCYFNKKALDKIERTELSEKRKELNTDGGQVDTEAEKLSEGYMPDEREQLAERDEFPQGEGLPESRGDRDVPPEKSCKNHPNYGKKCSIKNDHGSCDGIYKCREGKLVCVGPQPSEEICDSKDNDCDGQTDEAIDGNPLSKECYSGDPKTKNQGICKAGLKICNNGQWSKCTGEVLPDKEKCDGKDNDCDGAIDEKCACKTGETRPCGIDVGECKKGVQRCKDGKWEKECKGGKDPEKELCDGKDNDCDGLVDEDFTELGKACERGVGACKVKGNVVCSDDKKRTECSATPGTPTNEKCDGVDNDCDGQIDEKLSKPCKNECGTGTERCVAGKWQNCSAPQPQPERCDGIDNDCDGQIDNNLNPPPCDKKDGVCAGLNKKCGGQKGWLNCTDNDYFQYNPSYQKDETKCDGIDNDCDGQTDENCQCKDGQQKDCFSGDNSKAGVGICKKGTQTCKNGKWGPCIGEVLPQNEICNGKDDDCDGDIDEEDPRTGQNCQTGQPGICSDGKLSCRAGQLECVPNNNPSNEVCDGKDNNCDGQIDEGFQRKKYYFDNDGDGFGAGTPVIACKPPSPKYVTRGGDCNDRIGRINPGAKELCDGIDNNCDRLVDKVFCKEKKSGCLGIQRVCWPIGDCIPIWYYRDKDGDGYFDKDKRWCPKQKGVRPPKDYKIFGKYGSYYSRPNPFDCDDDDRKIQPNQRPDCGSDEDKNCNGVIDKDECKCRSNRITSCSEVTIRITYDDISCILRNTYVCTPRLKRCSLYATSSCKNNSECQNRCGSKFKCIRGTCIDQYK